MINQLFIHKPPEPLILTCINILGWVTFTDKRVLIRSELEKTQVVANFSCVINELKLYYLPCKQDKYLTNINVKAIITIVRQLLKTIGYNIRGIERVMDNKKEMIYKLEPYVKSMPATQHQILNNNMITKTNQNKFIVCWN